MPGAQREGGEREPVSRSRATDGPTATWPCRRTGAARNRRRRHAPSDTGGASDADLVNGGRAAGRAATSTPIAESNAAALRTVRSTPAVAVPELLVEQGPGGVGEDQAAGDEGDAEQDGEQGQRQSSPAGHRCCGRVSRHMGSLLLRRARRGVPCGPGWWGCWAGTVRRRCGRRRGRRPGRRRTAATGSWVTMTMVWPSSRTAWRMNARISAPVRESRLPVGSSAKMICGRLARARATATRCCWPPDSSRRAVPQAVAEADAWRRRVEPRRVGLAAGEAHRAA